MDERTTLALRALAFRLIADRLKTADAASRAAIDDTYPVKGREVVWLGEGEQVEVGHVRRDKGAITATVTDARALLEWARDRHPDQVFTPEPVEQLRPAFVAVLLATAKEQGIGVDPKSGEIVPGISVTFGDPKVVVVPAKTAEAEAALVELLRTDRFALRSLLQLPGAAQ